MTNENQPPPEDDLSLDRLSQAFASAMGRGGKGDPDTPDDRTSDNDDDAGDDVGRDVADEEEEDFVVSPASILEAILFVGHPDNEPLSARVIAALMRGVSPAEVDQLIGQLNDRYQAAEAPYEVASVGNGYAMTLRAEFEPVRDRFYGRMRRARLSQAAIDVLAIVAYHQPISRNRVSELRSKPSGTILTQLVRRQLLEVEHIVEDKQRTMLYRTSERFLALFHLRSLDELPQSLESPQ